MVDVARGEGELGSTAGGRLRSHNQTGRCCIQELLITDKVRLHLQCLSGFLGPVQESKVKCFCLDHEKTSFLS